MCIESNFECVGAVSVIIQVDPKPVSISGRKVRVVKTVAKRAKKAPLPSKHRESSSFCDLSL